MKVRALVVDDEELAREEVCFLLRDLDGVEIVGVAGNGVDALSMLEELAPDVVFLDVQMPGMNGFEVARRVLEREAPTEIVFVTAFDQYALDAFQVNAVDYLLKPVDLARLEQAVGRARRRVSSDRGLPGLANQELERLVQMMADRQARPSPQLAVRVGERFVLTAADEVIYASLANEVVTIVASTLTGTSSCRTLDELQAQLDSDVFWRVHRSYLVNINKIKEIVPWFSRNFILRMKDAKATEIPVSRTQTKRLREYLKL
ncbi:MAG: LytR/AlgR family response regulator transcription factor [Vicinamibacteraceae bacterium]